MIQILCSKTAGDIRTLSGIYECFLLVGQLEIKIDPAKKKGRIQNCSFEEYPKNSELLQLLFHDHPTVRAEKTPGRISSRRIIMYISRVPNAGECVSTPETVAKVHNETGIRSGLGYRSNKVI